MIKFSFKISVLLINSLQLISPIKAFMIYFSNKKITISACAIFISLNTIVVPVPKARAEIANEKQVYNSQLRDVASKFLNNIEKKRSIFDASKSDSDKSDLQKDLSQVPEGTTLLLRPRVGNLAYEFDVYAVKKNNSVYFSLLDVVDILELAVDFDPVTKSGSGWFLREDWEIDLDFENRLVTSKGQEIRISDLDFYEEGGEVFVSQEALSQWFDMELISDVSQQYLEINSPYPLPGVARNYRQQRAQSAGRSINKAQLPRQKTTYDWFDINTADVRFGTRYRKIKDADATILRSASAAVQGQLLKHEAYALASGDSRENLTSVRARLSKRDEDAVLLGALKARSYVIGDTDSSDIPLTGDSRQELGFRVSNNPLTNTEFETTDINGDALPNWDVELYRNGILIGNQLIEDTGRYEFSDVQLFAGDNLFEIFFYGPQGEIRNKTINIPVNQALLSSQDDTYDVSVSLSETNTFAKNQTDDEDRNSPHFAARYNKVIGDTLGYVGVRNRDIEGDNKTFLGVGATQLIANTIVDVNAGVDDEANTALQAVARKNISDWNLALRGKVQDENYQPDETTNPRIYEVGANVQRAFKFNRRTRSNISAQADYGEVASGDVVTTGRLGLSLQVGHYYVSNNTFYETLSPTSGDDSERLENTLSVRANMGKVFVRGGVNYDIKPEAQVDEYFSQITYRPSSKFSGDLYLDHSPDSDFSEARLNLNYAHKYFRSSPFIEVDSNDEVFAGLNLNFNLIDDPKAVLPIVTSQRTVGRSMVSACVYHDKNGDLKYNEGDEVLPEVFVESLNIRRRAETNEEGYTLIRDLSGVRATDIVLDEQTLPDPFMVSARQGVSIMPSAGEVTELEFPVHLAGEIDGTVSIRQEDGSSRLAKGGDIVLYPLDVTENVETKKINVPVAFDGFYIASQVPPGRYLKTVSQRTTDKLKAAAPKPRFVEIGYNGDTLYGYNVELLADHKNVDFRVSYDIPQDVAAKAQGLGEIVYALKVGDREESKLKSMLSSFAKKQIPSSLLDGLSLIFESDDKKEKLYTISSNDLDTLYQRCEIMLDYGVSCSIDVWIDPIGHNQTKVASK